MIYHHVRQQDENGCGIAAIAMVTHRSYWDARRATHPRANPTKFIDGVDDYQLSAAIKRLGYRGKFYNKFSPTKRFFYSLKNDSIITVEYYFQQGGSHDHTVVWCSKRKRFFDPGDNGNSYTFEQYFQYEECKVVGVFELTKRYSDRKPRNRGRNKTR